MPNPQDVLSRKMAGRGGWTAHLDLADALKVMKKEKPFHIATIKWLIGLLHLIPVPPLSRTSFSKGEISHFFQRGN